MGGRQSAPPPRHVARLARQVDGWAEAWWRGRFTATVGRVRRFTRRRSRRERLPLLLTTRHARLGERRRPASGRESRGLASTSESRTIRGNFGPTAAFLPATESRRASASPPREARASKLWARLLARCAAVDPREVVPCLCALTTTPRNKATVASRAVCAPLSEYVVQISEKSELKKIPSHFLTGSNFNKPTTEIEVRDGGACVVSILNSSDKRFEKMRISEKRRGSARFPAVEWYVYTRGTSCQKFSVQRQLAWLIWRSEDGGCGAGIGGIQRCPAVTNGGRLLPRIWRRVARCSDLRIYHTERRSGLIFGHDVLLV